MINQNMVKKAGFTLIFAAFLSATPLWAAPTMKLPKPEIETLPNGLRVVWFLSDKLPVVDLSMDLKTGTRDDLPGKSGTAELVAATLDRGAGGLSARQIAERVESLGASRGASADDDFFHVGFHGLATDADVLLSLLSLEVRKPEFPADEVRRERSRILGGWAHLKDYGESLVDLAFRRALTLNTSYGRGSILSGPELAKISRGDVVSWWKKNATPANATLMVVGKVDRDSFRKKLVSLFGDWKGSAPKRVSKSYRALSFNPKSDEILLLDRPSLNQAQVRIGFRAPLVTDPRHYSLTVGNALLGEYFHSRLNTLIRDQLGLTYGISSAISYNRDYAAMMISAATRNEATGELIQKSVGVLKGLTTKEPPSSEEVETAKEYLIGGFPLSTSTLEAVAGRWILQDLFGLGPDRLNEFVPKISAVTAPEVSKAVDSAFKLKNMVVAVAGDAAQIEPLLKKAGYKVRRVSVQGLLNGR